MANLNDQVIAICNYVKEKGYSLTFSEIKELNKLDDYDYIEIETLGHELRVLTEDETESAWVESIESYIDECILSEIPERYRTYFNHDKFIDDAKIDGVGHSLGTYDGIVYEYKTNKMEQWINIFRVG